MLYCLKISKIESTHRVSSKVETKEHNVMTDEKFFLISHLRVVWKKYDSIRKIATDQGDHYANGCLLDYSFLKKLL